MNLKKQLNELGMVNAMLEAELLDAERQIEIAVPALMLIIKQSKDSEAVNTALDALQKMSLVGLPGSKA